MYVSVGKVDVVEFYITLQDYSCAIMINLTKRCQMPGEMKWAAPHLPVIKNKIIISAFL